MNYIRNESTLKQLKKEDILQLIVSDILSLTITTQLASKRVLIKILNRLDDLLVDLVEKGIK